MNSMHVLILNVHPSLALGASLQQNLASACFAHIDHLKQPIDRIINLSKFPDTIAERVKAADIAFLPAPCLSGSIIRAGASSPIIAE